MDYVYVRSDPIIIIAHYIESASVMVPCNRLFGLLSAAQSASPADAGVEVACESTFC